MWRIVKAYGALVRRPPFAGYVRGTAPFPRAAAEVLTAFTGDAYFPEEWGRSLPANEFLVFEDGPSVDVELQWATTETLLTNAACRIYGGIHPADTFADA